MKLRQEVINPTASQTVGKPARKKLKKKRKLTPEEVEKRSKARLGSGEVQKQASMEQFVVHRKVQQIRREMEKNSPVESGDGTSTSISSGDTEGSDNAFEDSVVT